jgi:hypothetical protein
LWAALGACRAWARKDIGSLRTPTKPRVRGGVIFLLLLGGVFCCLGSLLSLPDTSSFRSSDVAEVPSGPVGLDNGAGGHLYRGATDATVTVPDVSYLLLPPAEEVRETVEHPVNASVLTMLVLAIASFGAAALWVLTTTARRRPAIRCSWGFEEDRLGLAATRLGTSFLGVFLL